ncbi:hypothetical protein V5O48_009960 [Marasmius crinis-equi]|uniref:Uncharacterized protein n=1 Tax=Marasmius crinis-equi TaxID=585013 RepID=A0ABR3F9R4_9AGAR
MGTVSCVEDREAVNGVEYLHLQVVIAMGKTQTRRIPRAYRQNSAAHRFGGGEPLKVKAETLLPTLHRPKVITMLKMPFPLPDVEVDSLALRKREIGKVIPPAGDGHGAGLVVAAEEIEDVIRNTVI